MATNANVKLRINKKNMLFKEITFIKQLSNLYITLNFNKNVTNSMDVADNGSWKIEIND